MSFKITLTILIVLGFLPMASVLAKSFTLPTASVLPKNLTLRACAFNETSDYRACTRKFFSTLQVNSTQTEKQRTLGQYGFCTLEAVIKHCNGTSPRDRIKIMLSYQDKMKTLIGFNSTSSKYQSSKTHIHSAQSDSDGSLGFWSVLLIVVAVFFVFSCCCCCQNFSIEEQSESSITVSDTKKLLSKSFSSKKSSTRFTLVDLP